MLYARNDVREATMLNRAAWILVGLLVAAAAYELALALRHEISPHGEGFVRVIVLVAMLAGAGLVFRGVGPAGLFAPSAAFFVTARFYTGDPYYRPTFRAFADGGMFPLSWVVAVAVAGVVAGALTWLWPRVGAWASALALLVLAFTTVFMVGGH